MYTIYYYFLFGASVTFHISTRASAVQTIMTHIAIFNLSWCYYWHRWRLGDNILYDICELVDKGTSDITCHLTGLPVRFLSHICMKSGRDYSELKENWDDSITRGKLNFRTKIQSFNLASDKFSFRPISDIR